MLICQPMESHFHGTKSAVAKSFVSYTTGHTRYCVNYHPCLSNYNFQLPQEFMTYFTAACSSQLTIHRPLDCTGPSSLPPRTLANTKWRKSWPGAAKTITYNIWSNGKGILWTTVPGNPPAIWRTASGFSPHSTTNMRPSCSDGCSKFKGSISATSGH